MKVDEVLQEIMLRLVDLVLQGGKAEKIIVSEKVYSLIMDIKLFPKCMEMIDGVYYIADLPVEMGHLNTDKEADIWFQIQ